jgi:uncharacterized protein YdgA (DUF945 family)
MKKIVIVVVVLAAICLVAPFGIGKLAEKRLNASLDKLVENAPYFKIADRKWTGGWFKSEQVVTFELADPWASVMNEKVLDGIFKDESAEAEAAMDAEGTESQPPSESEPAGDAAPEATPEATPDSETPAEEAAPDAAAVTPMRFSIRNEVLHGPVLGLSGLGLARVDTHLDLSEETRKQIAEVFGEKPAMQVRTRVGFFGGGTTTFTSEGRKLNVKDETIDASYETFKLAVGIGRKGNSYDVDGKLPSIIVKNTGGGGFSMTDLTIDGEGERVMGDLYDGDFAFKVKELKVEEKGDPNPILVQDAHYIVDTRTKDDFVKVATQMGTGVVKGGDIAKSGIAIKEIHYDLSFGHLHAPTLEKMVQSMRNMYTAPMIDPAAVEDTIMGPLKEHAAELLKHDPEFGIDRIGLVTPDGEIMAKGLIKLAGATPDDFVGAGGGMALIGKLDADITVTADVAAVEKLPNGATAAGAAIDSGYVKKENGKLICHIVFKKGELTVNGKPQAIPGLGGPPGGSMEGGEGQEGAMDDSGVPPQE